MRNCPLPNFLNVSSIFYGNRINEKAVITRTLALGEDDPLFMALHHGPGPLWASCSEMHGSCHEPIHVKPIQSVLLLSYGVYGKIVLICPEKCPELLIFELSSLNLHLHASIEKYSLDRVICTNTIPIHLELLLSKLATARWTYKLDLVRRIIYQIPNFYRWHFRFDFWIGSISSSVLYHYEVQVCLLLLRAHYWIPTSVPLMNYVI